MLELDVAAQETVGNGRGGGVVRLDLGAAVEEAEHGADGCPAFDEVGGEGQRLGCSVGGDHEDHEYADRLGEVGEPALDEVGRVP